MNKTFRTKIELTKEENKALTLAVREAVKGWTFENLNTIEDKVIFSLVKTLSASNFPTKKYSVVCSYSEAWALNRLLNIHLLHLGNARLRLLEQLDDYDKESDYIPSPAEMELMKINGYFNKYLTS